MCSTPLIRPAISLRPLRAEPACKSDFNAHDGFFLNGAVVAANVEWVTYASGSIIKSYNFPITPALSGAQVRVG